MKYIECNCCGKKIYFGENIIHHKMYCGIYCSNKCFLIALVPERCIGTLNMEIAENCGIDIKED